MVRKAGRFILDGRTISGGMTVLIVMSIFMMVWAQSRTNRLQLQLEKAGQTQRILQRQLEVLTAESRRNSSLSEIENRARKQLNLTTPDPQDVTILNLPPVATPRPEELVIPIESPTYAKGLEEETSSRD